MSKRPTLIIIVILVALLAGSLFYLSSSKKQIPSNDLIPPEKVVEEYYTWYIDCVNSYFNNITNKGTIREICSYKKNGVLDNMLIQRLNTAVAHDPVLCAQNTPDGKIKIDKPLIKGDTAETTVHTYYSSTDNPIKIELKLRDNSWKIKDIICTKP